MTGHDRGAGFGAATRVRRLPGSGSGGVCTREQGWPARRIGGIAHGPASTNGRPLAQVIEEVVVGGQELGVVPQAPAPIVGVRGSTVNRLGRVESQDDDGVGSVPFAEAELINDGQGVVKDLSWGAAGPDQGIAVGEDADVAAVADHHQVGVHCVQAGGAVDAGAVLGQQCPHDPRIAGQRGWWLSLGEHDQLLGQRLQQAPEQRGLTRAGGAVEDQHEIPPLFFQVRGLDRGHGGFSAASRITDLRWRSGLVGGTTAGARRWRPARSPGIAVTAHRPAPRRGPS